MRQNRLAAIALMLAIVAPRAAVGQSIPRSFPCSESGAWREPRMSLASVRGTRTVLRQDDERSARMAAAECEPSTPSRSPTRSAEPSADDGRADWARGIRTNHAEWDRDHDIDGPFGVRDEDARARVRAQRREDFEERLYEEYLIRQLRGYRCRGWERRCTDSYPSIRGRYDGRRWPRPPSRDPFAEMGRGLRSGKRGRAGASDRCNDQQRGCRSR